MLYTDAQRREILHCILDFGELYLNTGGEISRVEDTLSRIGRAYGAVRMDVFVITSSIVVTMESEDGESMTESRRIESAGSTDFTRFEELNSLSRRVCGQPMAPELFREEIRRIGEHRTPFGVSLAGSMLAAGSLSMFFGGSWMDGIAAAIFGAAICWLQSRIGRTSLNTAASNLLISLIIGLGAGIAARMIPVLNMDLILIGDIMLLIPGIAMTNAVQNMLVGNPLSGVVRFTEALIWAGALAFGIFIAIWIMILI